MMWKWLGGSNGVPIRFLAQQTPLIMDPLSTILFGHASCTGVSILYVDALRTVGIPARMAGTPAWQGNVSLGNHNWVEVWLGAKEGWRFIEARPAGGGETFGNPCDKWFCTGEKLGFASNTQVFATRFDRSTGSGVYPMSWDLDNIDIAGVNRTSYYIQACEQCTNTTTYR
jgi:hypothetical protein